MSHALLWMAAMVVILLAYVGVAVGLVALGVISAIQLYQGLSDYVRGD